MKVESLWISDVHLGSRGCKAEELLEVLKMYEPKKLYIVGDFIDAWLLKKRHWWPQTHTNVIRKVLSYSKNGTEVYYITGNHDAFLRNYEHGEWGNVHICNQVIHEGVLMLHGDKFDTLVTNTKWIAEIGGWSYEIIIRIDHINKKMRNLLGLKPRSISKWIKKSVKSAFLYIDRFERLAAREASRNGCHTVICGHIHTPSMKMINQTKYVNTGDWIENMSYVIQVRDEMKLMVYESK